MGQLLDCIFAKGKEFNFVMEAKETVMEFVYEISGP